MRLAFLVAPLLFLAPVAQSQERPPEARVDYRPDRNVEEPSEDTPQTEADRARASESFDVVHAVVERTEIQRCGNFEIHGLYCTTAFVWVEERSRTGTCPHEYLEVRSVGGRDPDGVVHTIHGEALIEEDDEVIIFLFDASDRFGLPAHSVYGVTEGDAGYIDVREGLVRGATAPSVFLSELREGSE